MRRFIHIIAKFLSLIKRLLLKVNQKKRKPNLKKIKKEESNSLIKHYEMTDALKENIGNTVYIYTQNMTNYYQNQIAADKFNFNGKILDVDDNWIKIEFSPPKSFNVRGPDYLYFRTDLIIKFSELPDEGL